MNYDPSGLETNYISAGPWGGQGGGRWDDGVHSSIKQLIIAYGTGIDSIRIEYDDKESSIWSVKHGGNGGDMIEKVILDYPDEFLTSISGYYDSSKIMGPIFLRSLSFVSNKRTYGPFGTHEHGTHFSFSMINNKIVGFHGRSGWYLDSIGVHMKHLPFQELIPSKALITSHNFVTTGTGTEIGTNKLGYKLIQGYSNDQEGYDIFLALKKRESSNKAQPDKLSIRSLSGSDSSEGESNEKALSFPSYVEKGVTPKGGSVVTYGPWGGSGGTLFDDRVYTGVRQVNITRSAVLVSIKVLYDKNGLAVWGSKNGGTAGIKSEKIVFDFPFEILTHISGYYGTLMYMGPVVIKSITFHTTKCSYGPYGDEQGTPFSSNLKEGKIVGFHGKRGYFVDSIGVHVIEGKFTAPQRPRTSSTTTPVAEMDNPQWSNKLVQAKRGQKEDVVTFGVVKEPAPCGPGPWGGDGGRPWDDGVFTGVKQIFLTKGEAIHSIQIEYDRNGQSVWSVRHGSSGGDSTNRIKLNYPHEVITCISGYYASITKDEQPKVVKSLTFYTSRGKYGPYGEEVGTYFTSTITEGKVVGFHGRSSLYLDAIGVHMQHWLGERRPGKSMLTKIFY